MGSTWAHDGAKNEKLYQNILKNFFEYIWKSEEKVERNYTAKEMEREKYFFVSVSSLVVVVFKNERKTY